MSFPSFRGEWGPPLDLPREDAGVCPACGEYLALGRCSEACEPGYVAPVVAVPKVNGKDATHQCSNCDCAAIQTGPHERNPRCLFCGARMIKVRARRTT